MAKKQNSYVSTELQWAEEQLLTWRTYIDDHPLHTMKDRIEWKSTKTGGMIPMVISSIEAQGKFVQETMKNYLALLEVVDKLREKEEAKIEARGDGKLSYLAENFVKNRK